MNYLCYEEYNMFYEEYYVLKNIKKSTIFMENSFFDLKNKSVINVLVYRVIHTHRNNNRYKLHINRLLYKSIYLIVFRRRISQRLNVTAIEFINRTDLI